MPGAELLARLNKFGENLSINCTHHLESFLELPSPRRKSQIQTYLEQNEGPGLQHLALKTDNIFRAMREMRARCGWANSIGGTAEDSNCLAVGLIANIRTLSYGTFKLFKSGMLSQLYRAKSGGFECLLPPSSSASSSPPLTVF